jgi:uncharacterized SAM-binding protein YcdF (DUF218 family)
MLIDPIWVKALVKTLVLPPTGLLLVSLAGLAIRQRYPRGGVALAWTGALGLLLLSMPVVAGFLVRTLDASPPFDIAHAPEAQAIVILGGGSRRNAPEYGGDTVNTLTLERVRYGAQLARVTHLPVLVTGGVVLGGEPEARLMREVLEREFGVGVRWSEEQSRTTHENAIKSAAVLRRAGIGTVVLVAHSFDMRRARAEFAAAGIASIPAATGIVADEPASVFDFLPGIGGLHTSYYAVYELLANAVRWVGMQSGG